ncbi:MAG: 50S ribosomal protein L23 [Erysipelotrichaceae bacterium]|jgi:large subunit ribosomal protein L23|nr:50S ribosomal protein L23 [Bacillota bacterium]
MSNARDIIISPIITEKTMKLTQENNTYTFKVDKKANKIAIKQAIEEIFNVNVVSVHTVNVSGKLKRVGRYIGRTSSYKKAIVKLAEGQDIDLFNY